MKPLPPRSRIKGDPFLPNRFVFGDAIDENGIEEYEYLIHTESPTFICRIMRKTLDFPHSHEEGFHSAMLFDPDEDVTYYACSDGIALTDFIFFHPAEEPTSGELQKICDLALQAYWKLDEAYQVSRENGDGRRPHLIPSSPKNQETLEQHIADLTRCVEDALRDPMHRPMLLAHTQSALTGGDARVLTETQCRLNEHAVARELLLSTARDLIARPEVARDDGTFQPYDLWAMPLMFSLNHAGDNWFFPKIIYLEPILREMYGLGRASLMHVSPTVFSFEMLRDSNCQNLVHLASTLDVGDAYIPEDLDAMKKRYQEEKQQFQPRLTLNWIIFAAARNSISAERRPTPGKLLEMVMPTIEAALNEQIEFGEASLLPPEPLWDALSTGTREYNLKRLFFISTLLEKKVELQKVHVDIEYRPAQTAFWLSFLTEESELLTGFAWVLAPDLAPDREQALESLTTTLNHLGMRLGHIHDTLH